MVGVLGGFWCGREDACCDVGVGVDGLGVCSVVNCFISNNFVLRVV